MSSDPHFDLRPATDDDAEAVAQVWHQGWPDGHEGHVPAALRQYRRLDDFRERVPALIPKITVAVRDGVLLGFVLVHDDEIEQVYVSAAARGGGMASALLSYGEALIGAQFDTAWLAVVAGNARARRFYERQGWVDRGAIEYQADTAEGAFAVPARRYEKRVGGPALPD